MLFNTPQPDVKTRFERGFEMKHSKQITKLKEAVEISVGKTGFGERMAQFDIDVEGKTWNCYAVSISHRDILCYCDQGIATFLVDSYGERHVPELFDWSIE
jgi:hypothetical protein